MRRRIETLSPWVATPAPESKETKTMFSKYTIALTALLLIGGSTIALAYDDPESKISDRYPFLEKVDRSPATSVGSQFGRTQPRMKLAGFVNEDVESKIADRYPALEQITAPTQSAVVTGPRPQQNARLDGFVNEDVEYKIGDRYPFLDQAVRIAGEPKMFATPTQTGNVNVGKKRSAQRHAQANY